MKGKEERKEEKCEMEERCENWDGMAGKGGKEKGRELIK